MPNIDLADEFTADRILAASREEESLFARGDDDALIRYVKPTLEQFKQEVTLLIDGEPVTIPKAKPLTDALGNIRKGPDGTPIPRSTTIYDAALKLVDDGKFSDADLQERIPVLCHQQHLNPVAMCRMCSVHISSIKRGKFTGGRKLVPACQHRVEDKMAVLTRQGPRDISQFLKVLADQFKIKTEDLPKEQIVKEYQKMVEDSTRFISELLVADHLHPDPARDNRYRNELNAIAQHGALTHPRSNRFSRNTGGEAGRNFQRHPNSRPIPLDLIPAADRALPYSSRSIQVDHDRCILCDRCARSCAEVKPFKVIGHTGKGYQTRISFDLDQIMNQSSCVQCGECMTSCPTGALTLNRRVSPQSWPDKPNIPTDPSQPIPKDFLTADEMADVELFYEERGQRKSFHPFRGIPFPYLRWNEGAVRRRELRPGEVLCNQGDFGSTAFLLLKGAFRGEQFLTNAAEPEERATGFWSWLRGGRSSSRSGERVEFTLTAERDLILGEIACLTNDKRTATVTAAAESVVLEVTRNMLAMLQRNPAARRVLDGIYKQRAIRTCLNKSDLFKPLSGEQRAELLREFQKDATIFHVEPGETIVAEGDRIGFDSQDVFRGDFYIILLGYVKVSRTFQGQERVLNYLQPNQHFGEIALLPDHPIVTEARRERGINPSVRTATCSALGDVDVVRIPGLTFRKFFRPESRVDHRSEFARIADRMAADAVRMLGQQQAPPALEQDRLGEFLRQGLYQSQKMLVLDLECCTRCDECTRACADAHGDGHSRLLREGLRFGSFLVAASCRSCHQPYCMDGCPVDAIHRGEKSLEIKIDDHCIGCGLCEKNCPYGSIQMVPERGGRWADLLDDIDNPKMIAQMGRKAVNCDLCQSLPSKDPYCVSACPHKAAFRMSGEELMTVVAKRGL